MPAAHQNLSQLYPSRIPPDFISRTLRDLLPPVDLSQLSGDKLQAYQQRVLELKELIVSDPVRWFRPIPGGQWDFLTCNDPNIQGLYFFAGNKTGKTTGAAVLVAENAAGEPLWSRDQRTVRDLLLGGRSRLRVCAFCEDFSTHEETIIPTLLSWLPHKYLAPSPLSRGPSGNITHLRLVNGTVIHFRTYDQGYAKAEGKDYDLVWCDEPPSREIYTAIFRGLVATRGRLIIAATLLSETWLYDEIQQPFVRVFAADIYQNPWLDDVGRRNLESLLDDDEREIRIKGVPTSLSGKVYAGFKAAPPLMVPYQAQLHNPMTEEPYPIIMGLDPHERKGLYIIWAWLTPENKIVFFRWAIIPPDRLTKQFETLAKYEQENGYLSRIVIMDPNRGTSSQIDDRTWQHEFEDRGYEVLLGEDNVRIGHSLVRELIMSNDPQMVWMESCQGRNGPLYQMERYTWDDHSRAIRKERELKEKVKKKYADFPDIHRYFACAHLDFATLSGAGPEPIYINGLSDLKRKRVINPYS